MSDLSSLGLDPSVKESSGRKPLILGKYPCVIVGDELKPFKNGNGKQLVFKWQIIEGDFAGEQAESRHNVVNPQKPQNQAIAQGELKRICTICGAAYPPQQTAALYGKPVLVTFKPKEGTNKEGEKYPWYEISGFNPVEKVSAPPATKTSW